MIIFTNIFILFSLASLLGIETGILPANNFAATAMIIAAAITAISNIIVARGIGGVNSKAVSIKDKVDIIDEKASAIKDHVNSAATISVSKIDNMTKEITDLKRIISEGKQREALVAQSLAQTQPAAPSRKEGEQ